MQGKSILFCYLQANRPYLNFFCTKYRVANATITGSSPDQHATTLGRQYPHNTPTAPCQSPIIAKNCTFICINQNLLLPLQRIFDSYV